MDNHIHVQYKKKTNMPCPYYTENKIDNIFETLFMIVFAIFYGLWFLLTWPWKIFSFLKKKWSEKDELRLKVENLEYEVKSQKQYNKVLTKQIGSLKSANTTLKKNNEELKKTLKKIKIQEASIKKPIVKETKSFIEEI